MSQAARFTGRQVIVTGGGSGIGAATCRLFAAEGATVTVLDRNTASAGAVAAEIGGRTAVVDVRTGKALALRHRAGAPADASAAVAPVEEGWDRLEVGFGRLESLVDELLSYGPDVVVQAPQELRSAVVDRLRAAAGAA